MGVMKKVWLAAHRGAPAYVPEHTMQSYILAFEQGCDIIEPDLVATKDGQLICRHENNLIDTTNVSELPEFKEKFCKKVVDGHEIFGWFSEDFTLKEIKMLLARERIPLIRPDNVKFNDLNEIPTFRELLEFQQKVLKSGRELAVYPETKHPSYFRSIGLPLELGMLSLLDEFGIGKLHDPPRVFIQSFETTNLKEMRKVTDLTLVQLVENNNYLCSPEGLKEIATYADVVAVEKSLVEKTNVCKDAKNEGLFVHIYTLRPENVFLPEDLKIEPKQDNTLYGDLKTEIHRFIDAGIDGFFCDASDLARAAIDSYQVKLS